MAAAIISIVSGACGVLLVSQINTALTVERHSAALAWTFAGLAVAAMLSRALSSVLFERLSQHALAELRRTISSRVLATDLRRLERLGGPKIQSVLSEHSANVAQFFVSLPAILTNAVIVIGCMIYMALLSWSVFLVAVLMVGLGSLCYHLVHSWYSTNGRQIRTRPSNARHNESPKPFVWKKSIGQGRHLEINKQFITLH